MLELLELHWCLSPLWLPAVATRVMNLFPKLISLWDLWRGPHIPNLIPTKTLDWKSSNPFLSCLWFYLFFFVLIKKFNIIFHQICLVLSCYVWPTLESFMCYFYFILLIQYIKFNRLPEHKPSLHSLNKPCLFIIVLFKNSMLNSLLYFKRLFATIFTSIIGLYFSVLTFLLV